ncbi:MAG: TRAP transporter TatT component family protein [Kofleriaceae bacterium]
MFARSRSIARAALGAALTLSLAGAACGPSAATSGAAVRRGTVADAGAYATAVAAGDAAFAQRADRAQLEQAVVQYEAAVALKDDDYETYEKLARAEYLLADGWLYFEQAADKQKFLDTYQKGFQYAERGLRARYPAIEERLNAGVDLKDAAALVDKAGIGLLYWYSTNLGKWGNAQDITVVLEYKDRIYAVMEHVYELDPQFFYGAADRYFGAYYAIAPSFAGGDLERSWNHFQTSIKYEPRYVATYNLIAEFYAPKKQDGALFDEMLGKVLAVPDDVIPELTAETKVEKRRAELLRKRRADGDFPF